jgi:hypothetical protein
MTDDPVATLTVFAAHLRNDRVWANWLDLEAANRALAEHVDAVIARHKQHWRATTSAANNPAAIITQADVRELLAVADALGITP